MEIKDIRQYRSVYKKEIVECSDTNRNEHFVGMRTKVGEKSEYGFFAICHGDKSGFNNSDGIRGFLEGFLDMAKDGQAVYEFLQNAVDAGSSEFGLFWGRDEADGNDYLMVVNNGMPFDVDSIRSILNVGVSTKSSDNYTIGKFGIGFKLAHRLVGRENGLDELINLNYGPILFSWQHGEIKQLHRLAENPDVHPVAQHYRIYEENEKICAKVEGEAPWLFKILVTNFPCAPENDHVPEDIFDCRHKPTQSAFSREELQTLGRWVHKYRPYLEKDFEQGALFFIRLGQGKQVHLEEENLEEEVKFSLAILNQVTAGKHSGLTKLNLNGTTLAPVSLEFESFKISRKDDREQYRYIRFGKTEELSAAEEARESEDADIELLLGYCKDYRQAGQAFLNAPNFYLFFPLNEEKHRLKFILHSNAFYKSSSRTYLQKGGSGGGINERLFAVFARMLTERMESWADYGGPEERNKFLSLYVHLLLSEKSENSERMWVNEPLYRPLESFVREHIPVKEGNGFRLAKSSEVIRYKDTFLPVDGEGWITGIAWFYWHRDEQDLCDKAENKLGVKPFTIVDLLNREGSATLINHWLEQDDNKVEELLNEIDAALGVGLSPDKEDAIKENLKELEIWKFEDGYYTIEQLGKESERVQHFLLFDAVDNIRDILVKTGWKVSYLSLSGFSRLAEYIKKRYQHVLKYLNNYGELIAVFNQKLPETDLNSEEKQRIVTMLARKFSDNRGDRIEKIRKLCLFRNRLGKVVALESLLQTTELPWQADWQIAPEEYGDYLDDYFVKEETAVYTNIVCPYWDVMIAVLRKEEDLIALFGFVARVYQENKEVQRQGLASDKIIRSEGIFYGRQDNYFYSACLSEFGEKEYGFLQTGLNKAGITVLPDYEFLEFYGKRPFELEETKLPGLSAGTPFLFSEAEVKVFLKLYLKDQCNLGDILISPADQGRLSLIRKDNDRFLVAGITEMKGYLERYYSGRYVELPAILDEFKTDVPLNGAYLAEKLIDEADPENVEQMADLAEVTLKMGQELKLKFIRKFQVVEFDPDRGMSRVAFKFVQFLAEMEEKDQAKGILRSVAIIRDGVEQLSLDSVHLSGIESVGFGGENEPQVKLHLSNILPNKETKATRLVEQVVEALAKELKYNPGMLRELWGLSQEVDKAYIYKELSKIYKDKILLNAEQLAFICLYAQSDKDCNIGDFKVKMRNGSELDLKDVVLYTPELSLRCIPDALVLDDRYKGIGEFLLGGISVFEIRKVKIVAGPYIENDKLYLPGLQAVGDEIARGELWRHVFGLWQSEKDKGRGLKAGLALSWEAIWGFTPENTIRDTEWSIPEERLPEWVEAWLKEGSKVFFKEKADFLEGLGISGPGSDILKIRKFLLGAGGEKPVLNYDYSGVVWKNTLALLALRQKGFLFDGSATDLLKNLYSKLAGEGNMNNLYLPLISPSDPSSFYIGTAPKAFLADRELTERLRKINYPVNALPQDIGAPVVWGEILPEELRVGFEKPQLEFEVLDRLKVDGEGKEWDRDFYTKWKQENPCWKILLYPGKLPCLLKSADKVLSAYVGEKDIFSVGNEIIVNDKLSEKSIIQLIEDQKILEDASLARLKELFSQFNDSVQEFIRRLETDKNLQDEWNKLKAKEQQAQQKQELTQYINQTERYTMKWFVSLLELMSVSDGDISLENPHGDITFGRMENLKDFRLIRFSNPSRIISPSIELYSDFEAIVYYTDAAGQKKSKQVRISGVSKKGNELIVMPSNPEDFDQIDPEGVKEIELKFTRTFDLTGKLTTAFKLLNFPDDYNFKAHLPEKLSFIFGPPGTGKTTEIARLVVEKMQNTDQARILILTPTNKAADVLAQRIWDLAGVHDNPVSWLVRFGTASGTEALDNGYFYDGNTFNLSYFGKCVLITTIQRFPYEKVICRTSPEEEKKAICEVDWDTIIFDEASMIMLPAIVFPLFKRKCKKNGIPTEFIIGGDPLQIPPVYDIADEDLGESSETIKEENIYTMVGLQSFNEEKQAVIPGLKVKNLQVQYRSIEPIGNIYSRFQYEGLLRHGRNEGKGGSPEPRRLPEYFVKLGFRPVTIIRYPVHGEDAIYMPQKLDSSPFHIYSAFLINELIRKFRQKTTENWQIGVISPYRAQATILNKLVESHQDRTKLNVISDTVHGFQGDECDMVFAVFNPSSQKPQYSRFFQKEYILNVAVSRARDYLVMLIPDLEEDMNRLKLFDLHNPGSLLSIIRELPKEWVAELKAEDLESQLMGKHRFFTENSFVNAHQNVNVYGDFYKDYMVRYSTSAVDIHIRPK